MKKTTQKELRRLVNTGAAVDITTASDKKLNEIREAESRLESVAVSVGIYGRNGQLLRGEKTGTLYAITARTTNVFWIM